jgi:hypothetical protein
MPRHNLDGRTQWLPTNGALAANRVIKLGADGFLALAGAADANAVGFSGGGTGAAKDSFPFIVRNCQGAVELETTGAITRGDVVNQAANGMVQSGGGTIRVGIAWTSVGAPGIVEVMPD